MRKLEENTDFMKNKGNPESSEKDKDDMKKGGQEKNKGSPESSKRCHDKRGPRKRQD